MSSIKLESNASGTGIFTIASPNSNTNYTLTLPQATTTVVGTDATQTLTNKTIQGGAITSATAQASTSGTSIDFTGIPSWVKQITVMFDSVSYSTTGPFLQVQIGDSGGVETTGYTGAQTLINSASASSWQTTFTAGFNISSLSAAADTISGHIVLTNISGNVWVMSGVLVRLSSTSTQMVSQFAGVKTLSATLDRVRVTTSNGTDTFDAGTINILYEG